MAELVKVHKEPLPVMSAPGPTTDCIRVLVLVGGVLLFLRFASGFEEGFFLWGHLTKPMQRTAKAGLFVERVLSVVVFQIGANRAGGVYSCWRGVVYSTSSYGLGFACSR